MADRVYSTKTDKGVVRWYSIVDIKLPDGKRKQVKSPRFETQREAKAWRLEQEGAKAKGLAVVPDPRTVAELMQYWLDNCVKNYLSDCTYHGYRVNVKNHILPKLGGCKIQALTVTHLQRWVTEMIQEGCKPRTIQLAMLNLRQALNQAVTLGWMARNVALDVKTPRYKAKVFTPWTCEEARQFLQATKGQSKYGPIWLLALDTGMRKSELTGLRWSDLDLVKGMLKVTQTIGRAGSALVEKDPKTTSSRRPNTLSKQCVAALKEHRIQQLARKLECVCWHEEGLVFTTCIGTAIHPSDLDDDFAKMVKLAGVRKIRIHDLRHTRATLAIQNGEDVKTVSESLGHANIKTTLQIYRHVSEGEHEEMAQRMGDLLMG